MYQQVIDFWFNQLTLKDWFTKSLELDQQISTQFEALHKQAAQGELYLWRNSALGSLAEIILLDQFSRNMYRDTPAAFAFDNVALILAQEAIQKGFDKRLSQTECAFLYMPFMHSESKLIHQQALKLFTELGNQYNLDFEIQHKKIIDRFGRYPHRNKILGRESSQAELEFLKQPNSSF
ncbi:DUF924 domain-containing protein [Catenovulum sp. 2E275]|uniref:DUF924 family protein n=1 Tax=Catenovulum sp. 2E275 TaxID=2980497 RepID=UPI0021D011F0|nr:DUF924 family protein [Catenovulum sp. 2E275]MCU4677090.1 DUF924 domain-containing protein [Catenovulum sp. 2E275]